MRRVILIALLVRFLVSPAHAAPMRVGVTGDEPFAMRTPAGLPDGLCVDLWKRVAELVSVEYTSRFYESSEEGLDAVVRGDIDILIGPIGVTADRAQRVGYTQPWYHMSLGIIAPRRPPSMWERVRPFMTTAFAVAIGALILILFIVGNLVWLAEKGQNPQHFPRAWLPGVANGMWLALVTMTTVGYGDRVPQTGMGRLVTGVWMLVATVTASTLTAGLATAFTLSQFDTPALATPEQLRGHRVAVIEGTTAADFARSHDARIVPVTGLQQALDDILADRADAAVFELPALRYKLHTNPRLPLMVSPHGFDARSAAFALPMGSQEIHKINVALLRVMEKGELDRIERKWLGGGQ